MNKSSFGIHDLWLCSMMMIIFHPALQPYLSNGIDPNGRVVGGLAWRQGHFPKGHEGRCSHDSTILGNRSREEFHHPHLIHHLLTKEQAVSSFGLQRAGATIAHPLPTSRLHSASAPLSPYTKAIHRPSLALSVSLEASWRELCMRLMRNTLPTLSSCRTATT